MAAGSPLPIRLPVFTPRHLEDVLVITGPVLSEVRLVWELQQTTASGASGGAVATFVHTVRLSQGSGPLSEAVHIENHFDLGPDPGLRDRELFMSLGSGLLQGEEEMGGRHSFYTDQTGLGYVERIWTEEAGIEGKYRQGSGVVPLFGWLRLHFSAHFGCYKCKTFQPKFKYRYRSF